MAKKSKGTGKGKKTSGQFDLFAARKARDKGMQSVADNNPTFSYRYFHFVAAMPRGWRGTNEDIKKVWPWELPHHHNAWGANWGACVKQGLLAMTDDIVPMTAKRSHARKTHIYVKT